MEKRITITRSEFLQMGWILGEEDERIEDFTLTINNFPERRKITLSANIGDNNEEVELSDYSFDYHETLADLLDFGHLTNFLSGQGAVMYNDDERQISAIVPAADVAEIIGDITWNELAVYDSFEELNYDLSNCSFGHVYEEPVYETLEANEQ